MELNQIEARLEAVEKKLADAELQIRRHEAARQVENLMSRYENLHSAHRWKDQEECFALNTPGVRACFNGAVYEGPDGIRNHYTGLLQAAEADVSGRIYAHELLTPCIEVAADGESAKAYYSSLGFETLVMPDGEKKSLWSFCKFRFGFVKENGEWKIYRFDMHGTFNTPFDGPGWSEQPYLIGFSSNDTDPGDPRWAPNFLIDRDENGNPLYVTLQSDSGFSDVHSLRPALVMPYETWDEGREYLYQGEKLLVKKGGARRVDPTATYKEEPFFTIVPKEQWPELPPLD